MTRPMPAHSESLTSAHTAGDAYTLAKPCGCIDLINADLAKRNARLAITYTFSGGEYPTILTEKIAARGPKAPVAIPSFCPFCGTAYPPTRAALTARES